MHQWFAARHEQRRNAKCGEIVGDYLDGTTCGCPIGFDEEDDLDRKHWEQSFTAAGIDPDDLENDGRR